MTEITFLRIVVFVLVIWVTALSFLIITTRNMIDDLSAKIVAVLCVVKEMLTNSTEDSDKEK